MYKLHMWLRIKKSPYPTVIFRNVSWVQWKNLKKMQWACIKIESLHSSATQTPLRWVETFLSCNFENLFLGCWIEKSLTSDTRVRKHFENLFLGCWNEKVWHQTQSLKTYISTYYRNMTCSEHTEMPLDGHQKVGNNICLHFCPFSAVSQQTYIGSKGNKPRTSKWRKRLESFWLAENKIIIVSSWDDNFLLWVGSCLEISYTK